MLLKISDRELLQDHLLKFILLFMILSTKILICWMIFKSLPTCLFDSSQFYPLYIKQLLIKLL